jgi:hypothetical protein
VSSEGWRSGVPLGELFWELVLGSGVSGDGERGCMRRKWRAASVSTVRVYWFAVRSSDSEKTDPAIDIQEKSGSPVGASNTYNKATVESVVTG